MLIAVATPKSAEEYWNSVPGKCLAEISNKKHAIKTKIVYNNTDGLSFVYNNIIGSLEEDTTFNYCFTDNICVFMHDDLEIHDLFFYEKLKKAHETHDIVGVAGASQQIYTPDKPSLWHLSCNNFIWGTGGKTGDGRGFITTPQSDGQIIMPTVFGPSPAPVSFVDGCFMSFRMDRVKEVGLTFDEDFKFHHYDLSICLRALEKGLKIGVWPIYLVHQSPGLRSFTKDFLESDKKFKEKYVR